MDNLWKMTGIYALPPALSLIAGLGVAAIAIKKGRAARENFLFSLVCLLWSTIPAIHLIHHLPVDPEILLRTQRGMAAIYSFLPFANIVFLHRILHVRSRAVEGVSLFLSLASAAATPTECFFNGLRHYSWGIIASGGPCFQAFGVFSMLGTAYAIVLLVRHIRTEQNQVVRLKAKYILLSLVMGAILTLLNIPAINGIDLYPMGDFTFLPMGIMAYGILRHRLMEIENLFHLTLMWLLTSCLVVVPNALLFWLAYEAFTGMKWPSAFVLGTAWFYANYLLVRRIQPHINRQFNRQTYDLREAESSLVNQILMLKSIASLRDEFANAIKETLQMESAGLYIREGESSRYTGSSGTVLEIDPDIEEWFLGADHLAEKNMVETNPYYSLIREQLGALFTSTGCNYVVPLMQNGVLSGLLLLGRKHNHKQINANEAAFLNSVRAAGAIALSNSSMFQGLTAMKDRLEVLVADRTRELQSKNDQMTFELRLAKKVQQSILPPDIDLRDGIGIVTRMIPLMEVSGDFYDIIHLHPDRLGIVIVDVSGHGMPAALLTSMIKTEIDSQFVDGRPTAEICAAIDAKVTPPLSETGSYFTMFLGIADLRRMELSYTGCGHVPPVLLRPDGTITMLEADGVVVGSPLEGSYEQRYHKITAGDRIFLYTDGLTDAVDADGELFGEDRLRETIMDSRHLPATDQVETILKRMSEHRRGSVSRRADDVTLMAVSIGERPGIATRLNEAIDAFRQHNLRRVADLLDDLKTEVLDRSALEVVARLSARMGRFEDALLCVEQILNHAPEDRAALYLKGKILCRLKRWEQARTILERLNGLDYGYRKTNDLLKRIRVRQTANDPSALQA